MAVSPASSCVNARQHTFTMYDEDELFLGGRTPTDFAAGGRLLSHLGPLIGRLMKRLVPSLTAIDGRQNLL
jgi:hypothetical protein